MVAQCDNCFFKGPQFAVLVCRRNAPLKSENDVTGIWPTVLATDWCGEYAAGDPNVYGFSPQNVFASVAAPDASIGKDGDIWIQGPGTPGSPTDFYSIFIRTAGAWPGTPVVQWLSGPP